MAASAAAWAQPASFPPDVRTRKVLDMLLAKQYDAVYAMFGADMKRAVPLDAFKKTGTQLEQLGPPVNIGAPALKTAGNNTVVTVPVKFKSIELQFGVSWAASGEIAGCWFTAPQQAPVSATPRPPYSNPAAFTETVVSIGQDPWKLPGTLSLPKGKGPFPAVVLVHGSGPNDRDETVGPVKVFRDLAEGLASKGIAVLRYDKRTRVYPQSARELNFTMNQETVDDALSAAAFLRTRSEIDPAHVYVLGHSQGGYMMPRILKRDPKLAGGIVIAGNVRPIEELIVEQATYIASLQGSIPEAQQRELEQLKKDPAQLLRLPPSYMDDLKGYNPAAEAAKLTAPMLILQGERDYQVSMKDFNLWRNALGGRANVQFQSYPKLNHLFLAGEGKSTPAEYSHGGNVDAAVVTDITNWIVRK